MGTFGQAGLLFLSCIHENSKAWWPAATKPYAWWQSDCMTEEFHRPTVVNVEPPHGCVRASGNIRLSYPAGMASSGGILH